MVIWKICDLEDQEVEGESHGTVRCGSLADVRINERHVFITMSSPMNRCFCSSEDNFDRHGQADNCNRPCRGDRTTICGGRWALSVFQIQ